MTYAKGSAIASADFNTFAGLTGSAAASAAAAQNKAGYLYGVGFGDRGYGQSVPSLSAVSAGSPVGQEWQNLRTILSTLASWQNTPATLLPPSTSFNAGANIVAHENDPPSSNAYDIQNLLALLDTNRLNYQVANMTLAANAASTTRASAWGSGAAQISCEFSVQFASEDAARYFFNTGGEIRIALAHPNTSSPQNSAWNTILNNSNFAFRANTSARLSGSYGTARAVGYYQLTTSYQTIIDGTGAFSSPYSSNSFLIQARALSIPGTNGGKGSQIYFRVILSDSFTSGFSDTVAAGTVATLSYLRAGAVLPTLPAAPTCTVVTAF